MDEAKKRRLICAGTVTAVILLVVLLGILIYQLFEISAVNKKRAELEAAISSYYRIIEETGDATSARKEKWWIVQRARELGYRLPGDINID